MMNYEDFREAVLENLSGYMSGKNMGMQMEIQKVDKVNRSLDGVRPFSGEGKNVFPTMYINDMYEDYRRSNDLEGTLRAAAAKMEELMEAAPVITNLDFDKAGDNIVFQLINTMQNKELLENLPHREYHDLSIVYRWVVKTDETGMSSALINDELAKRFTVNEDQLFRMASENTRRLFPPVVKPIEEIIKEIMLKEGIGEEFSDILEKQVPPEYQMYVLTNVGENYGATTMLYEEELHKLAEKVGSDLYILPSSINEVIAVTIENKNPNELAMMVADINRGQVSQEERLSNQVYHYDKELRKLSLATDTPQKSIGNYENEMHRNDRIFKGGISI